MTTILLDVVSVMIMLAWVALLAGFAILAVTAAVAVVQALGQAAHKRLHGSGGAGRIA